MVSYQNVQYSIYGSRYVRSGIFWGVKKTCCFTIGFEIILKLNFELKILKVADSFEIPGTYDKP